jgi:TM2 domain-containing membrane protein YozV
MSSPEVIPTGEAPPLPPATTLVTPAPRPSVPNVKSPWVALLLSLVMPGLGQVYNGQIARALTFFVAFSGSIYLIVEDHPLPFAIFLPFIVFANMIDAYRSATVINARGIRPGVEEDEAESPWWGGSLVAMGVVLFLNNMGWLRLGALVRYWPLLLIGAGVVLLRRAVQRKGGNATAL